jgi:hypothetical protein
VTIRVTGMASGSPPRSRLLALLSLAALVAGRPALPAEVAADGWQRIGETDGIAIERQPVTGSPVPRLRVRGIIPAAPARVYAVVSDYDHFAEFVPDLALSHTLNHAGNVRWVRQRVALPGPLSPRDYVIRVTDDLHAASQGRYRVSWRLDREATRGVDGVGVVPERFVGRWHLRPGPAPGTTEAVYTVLFDPGGLVPRWLVGFGSRHILPGVFAAVRRRAAPDAAPARPAPNPAMQSPR